MRRLSVFLASIFLLAPLYGAFDYPAGSAGNAALGNSNIASTVAADGLFLNPALLINSRAFYAALNYSQLYNLKELQYANGMIALPYKSFGVGLGVEDFGASLYRENKFTIGIAKSFYNNAVAIGFSSHLYHVAVEGYGSSSAVGVSIGLRYRVSEALHLAGAIENLNQPELNGYGEEIPQRIQAGLQFQPVDALRAHLKVQKDSWYSPEVLFGVEYRVFGNLQLYSGYSTLATLPSFGLSLGMFNVEVNYALQYHFDLGQTHFAGIAFHPGRWGIKR